MWQSIPVCNTNTPEDQELKVILDMQQVGDQPELQVTISEGGGRERRREKGKERQKDRREREVRHLVCLSSATPALGRPGPEDCSVERVSASWATD